MRYREILEGASAEKVYYHGTANFAAAEKIMQDGIVPPDFEAEGRKDNMLRPVAGRVYITPRLGYAQMYAIGGNFAGSSHYRVPYEGNEATFKHVWSETGRHAGRYGYLFVIPAAEVRGHMQPDEDEIGEFYALALDGGPGKYHEQETHEIWKKLTSNSFMFDEFKRVMGSITTDNERRKLKDGEYAYYAKVGKKALANQRFDGALINYLIKAGCHIAHEGTLKPSQCWRIDKAKVGWLEKDGSNFFKIAERIA